VPSRPQEPTGDQGQLPATTGGAPAGTNEQTPGAPGTLHALQVSVQAVSQQTPSAQNPLRQSAAQAQG
jgi:hypothetical protein